MTHAEEKSFESRLDHLPFWARLVKGWADRIVVGSLTIRFPNGSMHHVAGEQPGPAATISILSGRFVWQIMTEGNLGLARGYMDGTWDSPDIGAVLDLGLANEKVLSGLITIPFMRKVMANYRHRKNANTKGGSRRNIAFHYDLGNKFYDQWLDGTMTYSSAIFQSPEQPLDEAQIAKYARIVEKLDIQKDDTVLEIGCGWGGFAEYAALNTGCRILCLTLSNEQALYAQERMHRAGLLDRVEIRIQDYRDCEGSFDKIVSIEMFEAVGEENWPVYFDKVKHLLKAGGEAMLQVITISRDRFDTYRNTADFIQTYIFPGGMLPSNEALVSVADHHGLKLSEQFLFGLDYEKTLLWWDRAFAAQWHKIEPLGFDTRFKRMWRYYLHYCAAGFRSGRIDVGQFHFRSE